MGDSWTRVRAKRGGEGNGRLADTSMRDAWEGGTADSRTRVRAKRGGSYIASLLLRATSERKIPDYSVSIKPPYAILILLVVDWLLLLVTRLCWSNKNARDRERKCC